MRGRVAVVAVVAAGAALAAAGCGRDGDREEVRSVTQGFFAALGAGDGAGACARLSEDTVTALESQEQEDCAQAVTGLQLEGGAPTRVQVYVTSAKADLRSGESAFLDRTAAGWRLSAVGCKPVGGKPADRPYDCELEA
jgi:hypothetical protein